MCRLRNSYASVTDGRTDRRTDDEQSDPKKLYLPPLLLAFYTIHVDHYVNLQKIELT